MRILFATLLAFILFIAAPCSANEKVLDIQEVTSKNGITAWLVEDKSLPIIALKFAFKGAGAVRDGKNKQGLARLLSNTMDEGAGALTAQQFQKALSDYSISLHFGSGRDNFSGQVKTLSRNKKKAFELLALALNKPRFDAEPLERMRQSNIGRIRSSMGDPDWITSRIFNDKTFSGHPYALNSGGTLSTLKDITANDLRSFKQDWLTKDRLVVGVMGDITKEELSTVLDQIFDGLPATGKQKDIENHTIQNSGKIFYHHKDIPQTIISIALPSFDKNDSDYHALRLMNYIFGGSGFGSRLMEEAREKRGLTYGIYSGLLAQDHLDAFTISTSTKNKSAKEMMGIINDEIKSIMTTLASEQELKDAKSYLTGSMPLSLTSTGEISSILRRMQLNNRPIDYLDLLADKTNAITAQDIQRVAKRIFKNKELTTIMVGNPKGIENLIVVKEIQNVE